MNAQYDYENLFLYFGGGLVVMAFYGLFANILSFPDFLCAIFAAYVVLRITNGMRRADNKSRRKR